MMGKLPEMYLAKIDKQMDRFLGSTYGEIIIRHESHH